jgi:hypothetical protein
VTRSAAGYHYRGNWASSTGGTSPARMPTSIATPPTGILPAHSADQISDFTGYRRPSQVAPPDLPGPEKTEALAMPSKDRVWLNHRQHRPPVGIARPTKGSPPGSTWDVFSRNVEARPFWWCRARFSSSRVARERKIEDRVTRSVARRMSIGRENYERSIIPIGSDISRFSRGTVALAAVGDLLSELRERASQLEGVYS